MGQNGSQPECFVQNELKTCRTGHTNHDHHKLKMEHVIIDKPDKLANKPVKPVCKLDLEHVIILLFEIPSHLIH